MKGHKASFDPAKGEKPPKGIDDFVPLRSMPDVAAKAVELADIGLRVEEAYFDACTHEKNYEVMAMNLYGSLKDVPTKGKNSVLDDLRKQTKRAMRKGHKALAALEAHLGPTQQLVKAAIDERSKAKNVIKECDGAVLATHEAFDGILKASWALIEHRLVDDGQGSKPREGVATHLPIPSTPSPNHAAKPAGFCSTRARRARSWAKCQD